MSARQLLFVPVNPTGKVLKLSIHIQCLWVRCVLSLGEWLRVGTRTPRAELMRLTYHLISRDNLWRPQGVTISFFSSDSATCVHEHFEAKTWWVMMVTLHEATSLLNKANGFTDRRRGHHPYISYSVYLLAPTIIEEPASPRADTGIFQHFPASVNTNSRS